MPVSFDNAAQPQQPRTRKRSAGKQQTRASRESGHFIPPLPPISSIVGRHTRYSINPTGGESPRFPVQETTLAGRARQHRITSEYLFGQVVQHEETVIDALTTFVVEQGGEMMLDGLEDAALLDAIISALKIRGFSAEQLAARQRQLLTVIRFLREIIGLFHHMQQDELRAIDEERMAEYCDLVAASPAPRNRSCPAGKA